jgi:hypothetical protein
MMHRFRVLTFILLALALVASAIWAPIPTSSASAAADIDPAVLDAL